MRIEFNPGLRGTYLDILALLKQYNLESTGSIEGDLALIEKAKTKQTESKEKPEAGHRPPPQTPPAIAEFMRKIGVTPTNSKEGDLEAITNKLDELEARAKTDAEKKNVQSLRDEFASLISAINSVGLEQMAAMNKFFMVK